MGIYDRDYGMDEYGGGGLYGRGRQASGGGGFARLPAWSANTWIIAVNLAIHLLRVLLRHGGDVAGDVIGGLGCFSTYSMTWKGGIEFWRFVTFQFLHASWSHVGFNMLGLYMFGSLVEGHLGRRKYLAFYLTCGIFGALMFLILNVTGTLLGKGNPLPLVLTTDWRVPLVGASAGVFGVIMACAYIAPDTMVQLLFPPVSMRMKVMAYAYVGLAMLNLVFAGANQGGDAAHIGGAIAGYFFIRRSHLLRDFFDVFGDSRKKPRPRVAVPHEQARRTTPRGPDLKFVPAAGDGPSDEEVDRILAKHKLHGKESLTPDEVETLRRATQAKRGDA
jgi:membrane associated rhomboid family serine protease